MHIIKAIIFTKLLPYAQNMQCADDTWQLALTCAGNRFVYLEFPSTLNAHYQGHLLF